MEFDNGNRLNLDRSTTETLENNKGQVWPQILAILAVTLGPFSNGIILSWSSPFALVISQDKQNYDITEDETSYFIVFRPVGMIIGTLFSFKIVEHVGSKKSVLLLSVSHLTTWIIVIFATTKWEFYASRVIAGIGDAMLFTTGPPYIGEITTPTIRGKFGNMFTFMNNGGSFFITALGSYCGVQTTAYICMGFPILFFILVSMLPESPYQLIKDGKYDLARKSIKWLIRKHDIEEDFLSMKADVERQISERGQWKDLIKINSNRRALRAGLFLRFSQQFCGIAVFASYTQVIFAKAKSNLSPQSSSMIFVGLYWILNLVCGGAVEKFGRRMSYFFSILFSGIILVILSVFFFLEQYKIVNLDQLNWFPLAGMIAFIFAYSFGLGVVPTLMLGELFSASIKSKGLSALIGIFAIAVFISTNAFNLLTSNFGLYAPFLMYGICCLVSTLLTLRWVPETKGKTLEEIQQTLKSK